MKRRSVYIYCFVILLNLFVINICSANFHAVGKLEAPSGHSWDGGSAQWDTPSMYYTYDFEGFTAQVLWVTTQNHLMRWVEVGLTKGWKQDNNAWTLYWAENTPYYDEYRITSVSPGPQGTTRTYTIIWDSLNSNFRVTVDSTIVGRSHQARGTRRVEVGGEVTSSGNLLTRTYPKELKVFTGGRWVYWDQTIGTISQQSDAPFYWWWLIHGRMGENGKR